MPENRIGRCERCCREIATEGYPGEAGGAAISTTYGGFQGGDPRRFTPDFELASTAEIAAWRKACEAAERDPAMRNLPPDGKMTTMAFIQRYAFGPGVTQ